MIGTPFKRSELSKALLSKIKFIEKENKMILKYWSKQPDTEETRKHKREILVLEYSEMMTIIDNLYGVSKEDSPKDVLETCMQNFLTTYASQPLTYENVIAHFYTKIG